ncbi:MAG TPA: c-type cytochrome [Saprospiraceae bacterium]|nr:c-type cytochrome [Saprospiraceae bacterium]HMQ84645.1 c-type cytochrome [Saprospiraceae bacterium]
MKNFKSIIIAAAAVLILQACSPADGNRTGHEYMPDMGHSIAQEANVYAYYYFNTWDSASTVRLKELAYPGYPVAGTVPRGYAGAFFASAGQADQAMKYLHGSDAINSISVPLNGHVPYYYGNTEEERTRATAEIIDNPFPISTAGLARGEELYNTFCGICHGEKGDGQGYLVSESNPNAKYPAAPANFLLDEQVNSSNGRYYHAIMYGKNVMGGYADKLSYEERWQVIHWIRALQAKDKKLEYSEAANTLNASFGIPNSVVKALAESVQPEVQPTAPTEGEHQGDNSQDHSHEGGDHGTH